MKYLSEYTNEAVTKALDNAGAFFAFSNEQFDEAKKENVKYVSMGMGMICPKENARQLEEDLDNAIKAGIAQDITENGLEAIIKRELNNHEAYYTRDLTSTIEALSAYPITAEDIKKVFSNQNYIIANN